MGSFCSCLQGEHFNGYAHPIASMYSHCTCLRAFVQQFIHMHTRLFQRWDMQAIPQSVQQDGPISSLEISTNETFHSLPRPLPYDDPRYSQLQRHRLVLGHQKSSTHVPEESGPFRTNNNIEIESPSSKDKWTESKLKGCCSEYELKLPKEPSSEYEDECPTCLEEYTAENPRIVMQCSHQFHLGCIYEWMERSEACPVCGKTMVFNEST